MKESWDGLLATPTTKSATEAHNESVIRTTGYSPADYEMGDRRSAWEVRSERKIKEMEEELIFPVLNKQWAAVVCSILYSSSMCSVSLFSCRV